MICYQRRRRTPEFELGCTGIRANTPESAGYHGRLRGKCTEESVLYCPLHVDASASVTPESTREPCGQGRQLAAAAVRIMNPPTLLAKVLLGRAAGLAMMPDYEMYCVDLKEFECEVMIE